EDLAGYRVLERRPLEVAYRDRRLRTNPPPTFGGALVGLALRRLEAAGPAEARHTPAWARHHVAVMAGIDRDRAAAHPEVVAALAEGLGAPLATRGTTHVSVADAEGNVAAMTTSNGECSGDVIAGTGIATNNMLGEDDLHPDGFHAFEPGLRVASMMAPTFVLDRRGAVEVALGSGGSKRIRTALAGVLSATIDDGLPLADAIDAPRLHWDDDHLEVEPGLPEATLDALRQDHQVNVWPAPNMYFGGVHAVAPGRAGAADGRRGGAVRHA
ncbi:MAG: gamma-glutamyltransferase, partial [Acidimicrobiales bacterium]|nr:gamma-glutamyltransferase [Acidimicrobiales bacterium]